MLSCMLTKLGRTPPRSEANEDPFEMLLACHGRIRSFSDLALRLVRQEAPAPEVAEASRALCRYFTEALPLHEVDEEETLRRALDRHGGDADWRPLVDAMTREHRTIDASLERLVDEWRALAVDPERIADVRARLDSPSVDLGQAFAAHLALEEERLFPLVRGAIPAAVLEAMAAEMRGRRRPR